jgi:hypothetical protein
MPGNSFRGALAVKSLGFTNGGAPDYYFIAKGTVAGEKIVATAFQTGNYIASYTVGGDIITNELTNRTAYISGAARNSSQFFNPFVFSGGDGFEYAASVTSVLRQSTSALSWAYSYPKYGFAGSPPISGAVSSAGDVYVLSAEYESTTTYMRGVLRKINSSGTEQYAKQFRISTVNTDSPNGLCIAGSYLSFAGIGTTSSKVYAALADLSLTTTFVLETDTSSLATAASAYTACDSSGNVYMAYRSASGAPQIVKLNSSGVVQWNKSYSGGPSNVASSALVLNGGFLWFAATQASDTTTYLWKININDGSVVLARSITHDSNTGRIQLSASGASVCISIPEVGLFARVPTDGTGTGTYTVGGASVTYSSVSSSASSVSDVFTSRTLTIDDFSTIRQNTTAGTVSTISLAVTQV